MTTIKGAALAATIILTSVLPAAAARPSADHLVYTKTHDLTEPRHWSTAVVKRKAKKHRVVAKKKRVRHAHRTKVITKKIAPKVAVAKPAAEPLDPPDLPGVIVETVEAVATPIKNIFQRFVESRNVVVQKHVRIVCADGSPIPENLQRMALDAADHFHGTAVINSAYRPQWYNDALRRRGGGAARNSQHIQCTRTRGAVDFAVKGVSTPALFAWVIKNRHRYAVNAAGLYRTHVHADLRPGKLVTWGIGKRRARKTMLAGL